MSAAAASPGPAARSAAPAPARSAATGPMPLALPLALFFAVFVVMPLALLAYVSVHDDPALTTFGLSQYRKFLGDAFNLAVLGNTLWLGLKVTLLTLAIGYPLAWFYTLAAPRWQ
ncbi:MAG: ABC transporter permease, partial [Burkholderiales bacterium]